MSLSTSPCVLTALETIDSPNVSSIPAPDGRPTTPSARRTSPLPPLPTIPHAGPSSGPQRYFYVAVKRGHVPGVYPSWPEAEKQIVVSIDHSISIQKPVNCVHRCVMIATYGRIQTILRSSRTILSRTPPGLLARPYLVTSFTPLTTDADWVQNHPSPVFRTFATRFAAEAFVSGWDGVGRHSLPVSWTTHLISKRPMLTLIDIFAETTA